MAFNKWLVISGSHYQNRKSYKKGAKFISDKNMAKFNTLPHAPKYRLLGEATEAEILQFQAEKGFADDPTSMPVTDVEEPIPYEDSPNTPPVDSLSAMSTAELKQLAADEEIDLEGASKKGDILKRIQEAREAVNS